MKSKAIAVTLVFGVVAWGLLREGGFLEDPAAEIQNRPGGHIRMKPAAAPNERAYRVCRKEFHWKSERREHRLCECIATDVRFDKFTESQMLRIESDLWNYRGYGSVREQIANQNAYDTCFSRNANIKRP